VAVAVAVAERSGIDGVRLPRMRRRRVGLPSMPLSLPAAIVAAALLHGLLFATGWRTRVHRERLRNKSRQCDYLWGY